MATPEPGPIAPSAMEAELAAMREAVAARRRRTLPMRIAAAGAGLLGAIAMLRAGSPPAAAACVTGAIAWLALVRPRQARPLGDLALLDDARAVPLLLDALGVDDYALRVQVLSGLLRLLPRVQASDAPLFSRRHFAALTSLLDIRTPPAAIRGAQFEGGFTSQVRAQVQFLIAAGYHAWPARMRAPDPLRMAALAALAQVGDESCAGKMEQFIDLSSSREEKEAAADCIATLRANQLRRKEGVTLLRAAGAPADEPSTVLRAGSTGDADAADVLLRPGG